MSSKLSSLGMGLPSDSDAKASTCNAGGLGSILGSGRSPGGGHGNPLQYSCLENPMDRAAWQATVWGITKSQTGLNDEHFTFERPRKCPWEFTQQNQGTAGSSSPDMPMAPPVPSAWRDTM